MQPHPHHVQHSYRACLPEVPYSRLFWRALKLANWSKNVFGEF